VTLTCTVDLWPADTRKRRPSIDWFGCAMTMRLASRPERWTSVEAREKQMVASALMCAEPEVGFAASAATGLPASEPPPVFG